MAATPTLAPPRGAGNVALVHWIVDRVNAQDLASLRQLWDDDTVDTFPDCTCRGADEVAAHFAELFAAFPDVRIEAIAVAAEDDDAFLHWRMTGTHRGPLAGVEATGRSVDYRGIDHLVLRDGRVRTGWIVLDQLALGRQLGLMPPEGSLGDRLAKRAVNARTRMRARLRGGGRGR